MINRNFIVVLSILAAIFMTCEAAAASRTSAMAVSVTVLTACVVNVLPLSFGNDPAPGSARDASTSLTAACTTTGIPFNIRFDQRGTDASLASRNMTGPGGNLANSPFYREGGRTTVWGSTVGTDGMVETTGASSPILTMHGRRLPAQGIPAGADVDLVYVTLTY